MTKARNQIQTSVKKRYVVRIEEEILAWNDVEVEAETEDEAQELAREHYEIDWAKSEITESTATVISEDGVSRQFGDGSSDQVDETELPRRKRIAEINSDPTTREALEAKYGKVWSTSEMTEDFEAIGFMAPYVVVRRRSDGKKGSLEFCHSPRFYFSFSPHE